MDRNNHFIAWEIIPTYPSVRRHYIEFYLVFAGHCCNNLCPGLMACSCSYPFFFTVALGFCKCSIGLISLVLYVNLKSYVHNAVPLLFGYRWSNNGWISYHLISLYVISVPFQNYADYFLSSCSCSWKFWWLLLLFAVIFWLKTYILLLCWSWMFPSLDICWMWFFVNLFVGDLYGCSFITDWFIS